jgi:3-deoxy-D-manno-octulosonic-acid transferase
MFYVVYRCLIWPILYSSFHILGWFNKKIQRGLVLRERVDGRRPWVKLLPPAPPTVWIHCASGEFEYAKPVISLLKFKVPSVKIVVSFFSPTYADNIRTFAGVDWVVPLPWDTPRALGEFLDSYRPFALLIARTDVWPEMARQARLRRMKSVLFAATLTSGSGRTRGFGRWATRASLDQLDEIYAVTDEDVAAFQSLGLTRARVSRAGDTRYDQVLARLASPKPVKDISSERPFLVCGSTWPEDEAVLIPALAQLSETVCGVLVPHEPTAEHVSKLEDQVRSVGLTPVLYSNLGLENLPPLSCLIVDQTGILAELYLKARWAFVGGSFRKTVHSVMEPLAAGCLTFVGPLHTNNREAVAFEKLRVDGALSMVTCVNSTDDLVNAVRAARDVDARERVLSEVRARTGSSERLVQWITEQL